MKKILPAALCAALGAATALTGCGPNPNNVSLGDVAARPTPEVMTLNERAVDVKRHRAYTKNVNIRMMWEDLGRVWLTDHPSRLNTVEVIQTSGKPR